ncbi:hypothetical protein JFT91_20355 [Pseudomonas sp. TH08]|uniref:hypothetical protein n=1 Tax=Pseudomonas sp. TH08 TaxID=2796374 RepID=UPI00191251FF|nr:hypothetical protein [Pseudomonas sp. TH08]MBK5534909.1 hypothetical protein [Pseudomonas sp. TH08]
MEHLRQLIGWSTRPIALASDQNGLGQVILSTTCQTSGARSSPCRKCDKTFA